MLFRKEAAGAAADNLHGKVIAMPKLPHVLFLSLITFWVLLVVIWLLNGTFARKATAQGWLEPKNGIVKIYADRPSKVAKIMVEEGHEVVQGDPLMEIHDLNAFNGADSIKAQLETELGAQRTRISDQLERERSFFELRKERLLSNKEIANRNLIVLERQIKNVFDKKEIMRKQVNRSESLVSNKFITKLEYEQILLAKLEAENEHNSYALRLSEKQSEISDYDHQLSSIKQEFNNTLDRLNSELGNSSQSLTQLSNQYITTITAPKSGVIANLQAHVGQQLRANELLLNIGDSNTDLEVIILMPIQAAGFVEKGQKLTVRYDSFPHAKFGLYSASITDVSSSVLLPGEITSSPIPVQAPVYKLKAESDAQSISAYGNSFPLKQGMTLTADITLENRTLAAWLLEPIISLRGKL